MQRKQQLAAAEVVAACDRGARVHRDLQALMVVFFVFYFIELTDLLTMFMDTVLYQKMYSVWRVTDHYTQHFSQH